MIQNKWHTISAFVGSVIFSECCNRICYCDEYDDYKDLNFENVLLVNF